MSESPEQARVAGAMPRILDEVEEHFGKPFRPEDRERLTEAAVAAASPNMPERESPGDKPAQTRATATDEQRARVSEWQIDLSRTGQAREAEAFAAVLADSEALAARVEALTRIAHHHPDYCPSFDAYQVVTNMARRALDLPARDLSDLEPATVSSWPPSGDESYGPEPAPTHEREEK